MIFHKINCVIKSFLFLHWKLVTLQSFLLLGYHAEVSYPSSSFISSPSVQISKWIASADAVDIDFNDEGESWDGIEWKSEIDMDVISRSGFGSREYIISQHVAAIRVDCQAPYPVEWVFQNAAYVTEDLSGIQMKTFRYSKGVTNPESDVFRASLEIKMESNRATGRYICRGASPQGKHLANDIFLFWTGNSPQYLVLSGKLLEIEVSSSNSGYLTLPCYVSDPSADVHLYKELSGEFVQLFPTSTLVPHSFDPKIGFQLKYNLTSDILGRYRCYAGDKEDNDLMEVSIKSTPKAKGPISTCEGTCFQHELSPGTRFYFDQNTEELICCGRKGGSKRTRLHLIFCSNPSACRMYEPVMYSTSGSSGKRSMNGSCVAERLYPRDFGLAKCKGEGIEVLTNVYTEFWTPEQENLRAVFDWQDINPQNMIHVRIHASAPFYNRQLVTATCQTLHSYFSDGIKWAIKWRNGSLSYFDSILSTEQDPRLHGIRNTYLKLTMSMDELVCFAPVWNSTQWIEKSFKLAVKPSRSPSIVGKLIEEQTFGLNETDKILECTSKALPPPRIRWMRNDEEVPRSMIILNENGTSVLILKSVSYETQATYKCIAMNEVGQAKKTFRIFVEDTRHSSWSTAFAVVIPILVIISLCILAFLLWKMQLQRKVVDHLTRVTFRETASNISQVH